MGVFTALVANQTERPLLTSVNMSDTPSPRNWSTKTLARELLRFLNGSGLSDEASIQDLVEALKDQIVEDEVGEDFDTWGKRG